MPFKRRTVASFNDEVFSLVRVNISRLVFIWIQRIFFLQQVSKPTSQKSVDLAITCLSLSPKSRRMFSSGSCLCLNNKIFFFAGTLKPSFNVALWLTPQHLPTSLAQVKTSWVEFLFQIYEKDGRQRCFFSEYKGILKTALKQGRIVCSGGLYHLIPLTLAHFVQVLRRKGG